MEWIDETEAAALLNVTRGAMYNYRMGFKKMKGTKTYIYDPIFPDSVWRNTSKIEYDKDYILKFSEEKAGKTKKAD